MIPVFKIFSLTVRVFARPVIYYLKQIHLADKENINHHVKQAFIYLGNHYHKFENKINRKFLKIDTKEDFFVKPLKDDHAVEKGVEAFYEFLIYSILIGLPVYEMTIQYRSSKRETQRRDELISELRVQVTDLKIDKQTTQFQMMQQIKNQQKINEELQIILSEIKHKQQQLHTQV